MMARCDVCRGRTAFLRGWEGASGTMRLCRHCYGRVTSVMVRYAEFMLGPTRTLLVKTSSAAVGPRRHSPE